MKVAVLVATKGRPRELNALLQTVARQTAVPTSVIISITSPEDIADMSLVPWGPIRSIVVEGSAGLPAQRNRAIMAAPRDAELLFFLDDDLLLHERYIETMIEAFADGSTVGAEGCLLADGASSGEAISETQGLGILASGEPCRHVPYSGVGELYGCNMVVRATPARMTLFDEMLPLYAYLEDRDFSHRLARHGGLVRVPQAMAVHRGATGSRIGSRRLGYSQVANVAYLQKKGTYGGRIQALRAIGAPFAKNAVLSLRPGTGVRRQRFAGNLLAIGDLMTGRMAPERILEMH